MTAAEKTKLLSLLNSLSNDVSYAQAICGITDEISQRLKVASCRLTVGIDDLKDKISWEYPDLAHAAGLVREISVLIAIEPPESVLTKLKALEAWLIVEGGLFDYEPFSR